TIVAHSLACILWFHYVATSTLVRKVKRAILVSPPSPFIEFPPVQTFFPLPDNIDEVVNGASKSLLIHSSTDPFCSLADATHYMSLGIPCVVLPHVGHINVESGHGPWAWMLELCLNEQLEPHG
ncbi:MAG: alpha/beta hydrolase, partial [Gorillibacterium sp.]|nr:alpha/beta hydrolase [Gorillibacterium sp.]